QQQQIELEYQARLASIEGFEQALTHFFQQASAYGANITTPFKELAYHYCDQLSERATLAGAVNTIKRLHDGGYMSDNTDGVGLVTDPTCLHMLKQQQTRVLIVGAGGAARGVIQPLLKRGAEITIANRTIAKAEPLAKAFSSLA